MRLEAENRMKEEAQKIREDQISSLIAALLANKSEFDGKDLAKIVENQNLPHEIELKIKERKGDFDQKSAKKRKQKKTRFEDDKYSDSGSNPEVIDTGKDSNTMAMFSKAVIKRSQPLTPKDKEIGLTHKLKDESSHEIEESLESIPYTDDFEIDESLAVSKPKGLLKTRSEIDEEIMEDYDDEKADTITEKIGGDEYSMTFEDISESFHHSKSLITK